MMGEVYKGGASPHYIVLINIFIDINNIILHNSLPPPHHHTTTTMYALTLLIAAVAAAPSTLMSPRQVASIASVDRYSGGGCTGTICVRQPYFPLSATPIFLSSLFTCLSFLFINDKY